MAIQKTRWILLIAIAAVLLPALLYTNSSNAATYELHHIFPQQFESYFNNHGINIDLYTIPITKDMHTFLHAKMKYNMRWKHFIIENPASTKQTIFMYAAVLLAEGGITSGNFHNYETKQPTGEKLDFKKGKTPAIPKSMTTEPEVVKSNQVKAKTFQYGPKVIKAVQIVAKRITQVVFVYEGGKLIYIAVTEGRVPIEKFIKALVETGGGIIGALAGAAAGSIICSPLNVEPGGGNAAYVVCVTVFAVAGSVGGAYGSNKLIEMLFVQDKEAYDIVKSDHDMRTYLEEQGYYFEDPWYVLWLKRSGLALLGVFICLSFISFVKRKRVAGMGRIVTR